MLCRMLEVADGYTTWRNKVWLNEAKCSFIFWSCLFMFYISLQAATQNTCISKYCWFTQKCLPMAGHSQFCPCLTRIAILNFLVCKIRLYTSTAFLPLLIYNETSIRSNFNLRYKLIYRLLILIITVFVQLKNTEIQYIRFCPIIQRFHEFKWLLKAWLCDPFNKPPPIINSVFAIWFLYSQL